MRNALSIGLVLVTAHVGFSPRLYGQDQTIQPSDAAEQPGFDGGPSPANRIAAERLAELLASTTGEVDLSQVLDEILADAVAQLAAYAPRRISPLAIRQVVLGSNLNPQLGTILRNRITSLLKSGTRFKVVRCLACEATTTHIEDDELVVTRGIVSAEQLRKVGESLGAKTFMDLRFGFDPERSLLELDILVFRSDNAEVVFAESFRADESTPMLLRSSEAVQTREARLRDLQDLLEGRPSFGWAATAGVMLIPFDAPDAGDIFAATTGLRLFERFGTDRRAMFGIDLLGILNFSQLAGGLVSAGAWWLPFQPNLTDPELRVGGKAGALIVGNQGNTTVFQLGAEVLLRYRFGLYAYATYTLGADFTPADGGNQGTLGDGLGASAGLSFNW